VPAAYAAFTRLPVGYAEAPAALADLQSAPLRRLELTRAWADAAREQYRTAARLATEGR